MKTIFICNNTNCRRRLLDANKIQLYFKNNDYNIVRNPKKADIIIFVTCAYRNEITNDAINKIKELQKYKAELIVSGCLPDIEKEKLNKIFSGKVISTKQLNEIDKFFPNHKTKFSDIKDADAIVKEQEISNQEDILRFKKLPALSKIVNNIQIIFVKYFLNPHLLIYLFPTKKEFYHVRISWGCKGNCTYCGIKKAIGPFKSKPFKECIEDFKKGLEFGYKNFVITADDVGAYGIDIESSFPNLLYEFTKLDGNYNISIQDLNPKWIVKYIDELEVIFQNKKITSINIALQNGSKRILKLMNRYSDLDKIGEALLRIKKKKTNFFLDTHIILGFPTETDEDFNQTIDFLEKINFDMGFIYRYSCKTGTEAEKMKPTSKYIIDSRLLKSKEKLKKIGYRFLTISKNNFYVFYR